uniref:Glycosyltransferase n=1 Tax=Avena strigosa TaxID=38783 RepID=A0A3S9LYS9_9POAL|nr:UGT99A6 [Avena strigosa]
MANQTQAQAAGDEAKADEAPHFVFVPLMAQGHIIPAVDTALLLATHGALCTVVATPSTAARVRPTIDSARRSGLQVSLVDFPLDYAAVGLPDGVPGGADNMDNVPPEYMLAYYSAIALLCGPIETYLRAHAPRPPTCVVSDFCHPWTTKLAASLGVPRLSFFSMCAFCVLCQHNVERFNAYDGVLDPNQPVVVPGLEKRFEVTMAQAPGFFRGWPGWEKFADDVERARVDADGVVMNTFEEMEPEYVAGYAAARGMKVWTVGPVSLYHQHARTLAARGATASIDTDDCVRWLDGKDPGSVVYVSFGSIVHADPKQIMELGLGLEASGYPFVWVVKGAERHDEAALAFLRGLEERVAGRGLLVWGWAPQALILSHRAAGAFVTHCGWNSTLEAVAAGLPVVTWPHFTDQFLNEKLAVEVLGIGVSVGVKEPVMYQVDKKEIVVGRSAVEAAVRSAMDGGEDGQERRRRARELAVKARAAVSEGGSSHTNIRDLVKCFGVGASTQDAAE